MRASTDAFADAVVVAAGTSSRMGGSDKLAGDHRGPSGPRAGRSRPCCGAGAVRRHHRRHRAPTAWRSWRQRPGCADGRVSVVAGGARRQDSVAAGVRAADADVVLVHDARSTAGRPSASSTRVAGRAALTAPPSRSLPVVDSLKRVEDGRSSPGIADARRPVPGPDAPGRPARAAAGRRRGLTRTGRRPFGDEAELLARARRAGAPPCAGEAGNIKVTPAGGPGRWRAAWRRDGAGRAAYARAATAIPSGRATGCAWAASSIDGRAPAPRPLRWRRGAPCALRRAARRGAAMGDLGPRSSRRRAAHAGHRQPGAAAAGGGAARGQRACAPASLDLTIVGARPGWVARGLIAWRHPSPGCWAWTEPPSSVKAATGNLVGRRRCRPRPSVPRPRGRGAPMSLRFRNTLGGALEPFEPLEPGRVACTAAARRSMRPRTWATSGASSSPTWSRRYLAWKGYPVTWVMNITDVDDKIIRDAAARRRHHRRADRGPHRSRSWTTCDGCG